MPVMKSRTSNHKPNENNSRLPRISLGIVLGALALLVFVLTLPYSIHFADATIQVSFHLICGWFFFLKRNLLTFSQDPEVLVSALLGTSLAMILLHSCLRWFFTSLHRPWRASLAITGFVFTLFGASFLIPGVVTMIRTPQEPIIYRNSSSATTRDYLYLQRLQSALIDLHSDDIEAPLPLDPAPILKRAGLNNSRPFADGFASSGYLYPAAGLMYFDEDLIPLIISPERRNRQGKPFRLVLFNTGAIKQINARHLETLLNRVAQAHKK